MNGPSTFRRVLGLAGSVVLCYLPAFGGIFTRPGQWYNSLQRPFLNPPGWVFGPVWTILYFSMGISHHLVCGLEESAERRQALRLFYFQLALNASWTPVFFGLHRMGFALLILVGMIVAICATIIRFYRLKRTAGLILLPYLLWCCFACYLNLAYFLLNR